MAAAGHLLLREDEPLAADPLLGRSHRGHRLLRDCPAWDDRENDALVCGHAFAGDWMRTATPLGRRVVVIRVV
jgi:hypothetical protein